MPISRKNYTPKFNILSKITLPFFIGYAIIALVGSILYQSLSKNKQSLIEGAQNHQQKDYINYYHRLQERELARQANMTIKQANNDINSSYTINIIHIGIMFFMTLCIFFTILNLDMFENIFSSNNSYNSNIYASS